MTNNISRAFYMFLLATALFSCKTQKVPPTPPVTINCGDAKPTYTADIKPIMDKSCASTCHSAKNKAAGIVLSTYETVKSISGKKKFMGAIRHQAGFEAMPRKAPKLSDDDILKIACWISNGSPQ